jgi:glycosyltransferase involved in cell wall biosynthesis
MLTWHVITSEYPPQLGGVADYTQILSAGLAQAGDEVHVWCPFNKKEPQESAGAGVAVHRQLGCFSPSDLRHVGTLLDRFAAPRRLLLQWVPHGYGYRGMNLPLCLWLWQRAAHSGDQVDIMVHEPYLPFRAGSVRHALVAAVQRMMTVVLLNRARRVWISIPAWEPLLKPYAWRRPLKLKWLPIPSVLPSARQSGRDEIRARFDIAGGPIVGHFGTYSSVIAKSLMHVLPSLLEGHLGATVLLIGAGSERLCDHICGFYPQLASRMHATGVLSGEEVARHLAACDIVIQPYPDGVSSRRTTVMAALALRVPVVTTKGVLTEPVWNQTQAVSLSDPSDYKSMIQCAEGLLADAEERKRVGAAGHDLYLQRFDAKHAIAALRDAAGRSVIDTPHEDAAAAIGSA